MLEPVHSHTLVFPTKTSNMDLCSTWKPSSLLEAMQETAAANCDLLGCGRDDLLRLNNAWVALRIEVFMNRYPVHGENVSFLTYPKRWIWRPERPSLRPLSMILFPKRRSCLRAFPSCLRWSHRFPLNRSSASRCRCIPIWMPIHMSTMPVTWTGAAMHSALKK